MTTIDPATLEQDPRVLGGIVQRFGGTLALNARVVQPGLVHQGDRVALVDGYAGPIRPVKP